MENTTRVRLIISTRITVVSASIAPTSTILPIAPAPTESKAAASRSLSGFSVAMPSIPIMPTSANATAAYSTIAMTRAVRIPRGTLRGASSVSSEAVAIRSNPM